MRDFSEVRFERGGLIYDPRKGGRADEGAWNVLVLGRTRSLPGATDGSRRKIGSRAFRCAVFGSSPKTMGIRWRWRTPSSSPRRLRRSSRPYAARHSISPRCDGSHQRLNRGARLASWPAFPDRRWIGGRDGKSAFGRSQEQCFTRSWRYGRASPVARDPDAILGRLRPRPATGRPRRESGSGSISRQCDHPRQSRHV